MLYVMLEEYQDLLFFLQRGTVEQNGAVQ